jgi:hypothetical protein
MEGMTMEEKNYKLGTNLAAILIYGGVCLLCGCAVHTGSRSGQVLNAVNSEPIQGAVVCFDWMFGGVFGEGPSGGKYYETLTDKDGKYYVPNLTINKPNFMYGNLEPEKVLIYKDGYSVYVAEPGNRGSIYPPVTPPIGYPDDKQTYNEKNNIVKLYPWKEGESHDVHIGRIDGVTRSGQGEPLKKELEPERKRAHQENLKKYGGKNK